MYVCIVYVYENALRVYFGIKIAGGHCPPPHPEIKLE